MHLVRSLRICLLVAWLGSAIAAHADARIADRLFEQMQHGLGRLAIGSDHSTLSYVHEVNESYLNLDPAVSADLWVELRLHRSLWAKRAAEILIVPERMQSASDLESVAAHVAALRTMISQSQVAIMLARQVQVGNQSSKHALLTMLSEHAHPDAARVALRQLGGDPLLLRRLGPERMAKIRPMRSSGHFDLSAWLADPEMSQVEFVDGDPDRVRYRGIELQSGDIGIIELNHAGDGILESFLESPGIAPHTMLYVTRRFVTASGKILYQPSMFEIYSDGWRCIPLTTALHPSFTWYSEWVRPLVGGKPLGPNLGEKLSKQIDQMEKFAFDFQARSVPNSGYYPPSFGGSAATCTEGTRVPFIRAGFTLPYPTTRVTPGGRRNLDIIGLGGIECIHTPTGILRESGFQRVGIIDNGFPEMAYAQALVTGRPEIDDTFGGWMSSRALILENLPSSHNLKHWRSAWEALRVELGQAPTLGGPLRLAAGVTAAQVPKNASPTAIAYYLRSDQEANYITTHHACPLLLSVFSENPNLVRLSELRQHAGLNRAVSQGMNESALARENWYAKP